LFSESSDTISDSSSCEAMNVFKEAAPLLGIGKAT